MNMKDNGEQQKHRPGTRLETAARIYHVLFCLFFVLFGTWILIRTVGKLQLKSEAVTAAPVFENEAETGIVHEQGKTYRYNKDITTILCMGIDTTDKVAAEGGEMRTGGQSDSIFLFVLDNKNKKTSVISIPRDTMTDIDLYDVFGEYYETTREHLTLQYAYGDGGRISCELTQKAVAKLMHQIPIHGYVSMNIGVIGALNDMVGGVTLPVCEEWLETVNPDWKYEETVTLRGKDAETYLRARDVETNFTAQSRLTRHKQYLVRFVDQALQAAKKDFLLPFKMYDSAKDYMVTNVGFSEKFYLASTALGCYFDEYSFYVLEGENRQGAFFDEFYVDEEALRKLIIELFYLPVNE